MKKIKKISILSVTSMLMCSMFFAGCGKESKPEGNKETEYKVTVKDGLGNPYSTGVAVNFLKDGEKAAMQVCDENGVAVKTLDTDEYTVSLSFTDGDEGYYYEQDGLSLSGDSNSIEIIVAHTVTSEPTSLYTSQGDFDGYMVSAGCTYVELTSEHRNYFLFTPTMAGTYEFSLVDDANAEIGYYGSPFYIHDTSAAEVTDNGFTISIKEDMIGTEETGTSVVVVGVDVKDAVVNHCILGIERIGEPEHTIEDEPWIIYETTTPPSAYVLPEGASTEDFDLTASSDEYKLVYNETDGFYHLDSADGALVLVYLTEDPGFTSCFKNVLDNTGVRKYFFDENGEFVKKVSYSECLTEYIQCADEASGLYPLTEDLKHIIQEKGSYEGWWDEGSAGFIFMDSIGNSLEGLNEDIAWLFMCCYISEN